MKCKTCGSEIQEIQKTIKIPELKIEVETEIHNKDETLQNIEIPKGWRLLKISEIIFLFNNKEYNKALNLKDTWEFIEQPFELNKKNDYVATFGADSGGADLFCVRGPLNARASLGVRFCRDIK